MFSSLYCIVLAGGAGSRLWPMSREMFPKQMFKLGEDFTLFQKTFINIASLIDDKNIVTTTNAKYVSAIKEQLKELQEKFCRDNEYKVLTEPISRNTAPAITIGVQYITNKLYFAGEEPIIIAVPCDQIISDREEFSSYLEKGINLAKAGYIVSFGTPTKEVNENFGYLKGRKNAQINEIEPSCVKVTKFIEKPTKQQEKELLKGNLFVNSGIYMFKASTFIEELKKCAPNIYKKLIGKEIKNTIPSISLSDYEVLEDLSIDYALMEKTKKLVTVPLESDWKDIGSWKAIYEVSPKDSEGNVFIGKTVDIDSTNSMVYSTSKTTATLGLKDTIVVETEDAVLVCNKSDKNGIKKIYKKLNDKNSEVKEIHKTVFRPWGHYSVLENGNGFLTKCITVNPNAKLSVQLHHHRSEHWIILEGEATILKGEEFVKLQAGESIDIAIEEIHSLQNYGTEPLKVLEIQQGDILDENDIERLEDIYGRA